MKTSRKLIGITGMSDIVERRIAVLAADSGKPGPVVWLTACIHGDEAGGTLIVHEVFRAVRKHRLQLGQLHALPLINSMGFENISRFINADREDLNRCFPGRKNGTMGEQIACRLFETITRTEPDLIIDLHNDWIHSLPYLLVEPDICYRDSRVRSRTQALAHSTGLPLVEDCEHSPGIHNTLTGAAVAAGIPAFTIEAGGASGIVEQSIAEGTEAVLRTLRKLEMLSDGDNRTSAADDGEILRYNSEPLASTSGLVRFSVAPGDTIAAGQTLARVYSAFGSCEETLKAQRPGIVLGLSDHARVVPGSEVIAVGETR